MAMRSFEIFRFGGFTLDVVERQLLHGPRVVQLTPKSLDVLIALVRAEGRLVTKSELLAGVWSDAFVAEGILTVHVSLLRKALGENGRGKWIETIPRAGYRFVGAVRRIASSVRDATASQNSDDAHSSRHSL